MKPEKTNGLRTVDIHNIRNINQTVLLHLIRERQPILRAEIAKITGLRPGTISSIVNRLIRKNVIYERAKGPSSGGRESANIRIPNRHIAKWATQAVWRMGTPEEIAASVLYLASDEAAFVIGTALIIDGGFSVGK